MFRTAHCGALTQAQVGERVRVSGWVFHKRDMGGVIFLDLRDCKGTLQVVCNLNALSKEEFAIAESVKMESVLMAEGVLRIRDEETYNDKLLTGTIELAADSITLISESDPLPFSLEDNAKVREDLRMEYRFLDIRRAQMQEALRFRHRVVKAARDYLDADGFVDVETPILTKSTPEGARDYLVPSRVHPGSFYALPQSPQIFKQLLMVGGLDRYYQVARCFRDEDLRADRQPEFTQLDMELSFVRQEEILQHLERLFKHMMREIKGIDITDPFPRMTWHQAMDTYGSDKPDIRFALPIIEVTDIAGKSEFAVFKNVAAKKGYVRAINVKGGASFSKTAIEELTVRAQSYGAKGMAWILIREDGSINSILPKYFADDVWQELLARVDGKPGDFILFCADQLSTVRRVLGGLRLELGDLLNLRPKDQYAFLIVTDFPEFEYSEEENRWMATHHPFTMPYEEDVPYLFTDPGRVRAQAYDVVLNGIELGSGSIRIHNSEVQKLMFQALGLSDEEVERRFGFFIRAFRYGTPPHGGFAFGLDRLVMLLMGADSLRDVTAFPKTKDAKCLLTNAPDPVDAAQLKELHILTGDLKPEAASAGETQSKKKSAGEAFDIGRVAQLASLQLTDTEQKNMQQELSAIIGFAGQLDSVDTGCVPVTAHVVPLHNVFREDKARTCEREALLENAPSMHGDYIRVPSAIE